MSVNIQVETVPDYYWQVVPTGAFVSADLSRYIVRDKSRYEPILQETHPLGNVTINNNVVVNNAVSVTYVEQKTNEKVVVHQVENTPDASKAGKIEGAAVEVFRPAPDQAPKVAAPPQPKKIEEVAIKTKTRDQGAGKPSTDELLVPPEIKKPLGQASPPPPLPPQEAEAPKRGGGKQNNAKGETQPGGPPGMQPGMAPLPQPQQAEGEQGGKQKKAKGETQPGGPPGMQPGMAPLPQPQQAEGEQGGKQKKAKGETQPGGPPGMQPGMAPLPPPEAAAPTGRPEGSEKKGKKGGPPCPEGTVRLENGTCAPAHQ
jgi:hypothetical protein